MSKGAHLKPLNQFGQMLHPLHICLAMAPHKRAPSMPTVKGLLHPASALTLMRLVRFQCKGNRSFSLCVKAL